MRHLLLLVLFLVPLTSCTAIKEWAIDAGKDAAIGVYTDKVEPKLNAKLDKEAPELKAIIDTNKDNKLQLSELQQLDWTNPQFLILLATFLAKSLLDGRRNARTQAEVDELYDKTHKP